ncbi:MAG: hypothetical protein KME67_12860 [Candidatus Thiodiazotropha sp. (ex Codakia orbicularis)]|nr:hypothetical protein [Candidatus Thiodiazotropha sp. (ex Codakia orbicularis)]
MKKSEKEFFKHLALIGIVVAATILVACCFSSPKWLIQVFIIISFFYVFIILLGLVLGYGPLKYLGKLYAEDANRHLKSRRQSQPWE